MNKKDLKDLVIIPLLGDYSFRKEWEIACWQKVIESKELLRLLTTSYERHNIVTRAAAIDGIFSGKSYKKICEELFISPQTISVLKKAISEKAYRSYLERSKKERKKKSYSFVAKSSERKRVTLRRTKYGFLRVPQ